MWINDLKKERERKKRGGIKVESIGANKSKPLALRDTLLKRANQWETYGDKYSQFNKQANKQTDRTRSERKHLHVIATSRSAIFIIFAVVLCFFV